MWIQPQIQKLEASTKHYSMNAHTLLEHRRKNQLQASSKTSKTASLFENQLHPHHQGEEGMKYPNPMCVGCSQPYASRPNSKD